MTLIEVLLYIGVIVPPMVLVAAAAIMIMERN